MAQSMDYISAELLKDKVLGGVYEIDRGMTSIARTRSDLQAGLTDLNAMLTKSIVGLTVAETGVRNTLDDLRGELYNSQPVGSRAVLAELSHIPAFANQPAETRGYISTIVALADNAIATRICTIGKISASPWKLSARKCIHESGMGFTIGSRIGFFVPRILLDTCQIISALEIFGKKISVSEQVSVELDRLTYEWCHMAAARIFGVVPTAIIPTPLAVDTVIESSVNCPPAADEIPLPRAGESTRELIIVDDSSSSPAEDQKNISDYGQLLEHESSEFDCIFAFLRGLDC
jgi:hypothetical protein